MKTLSHIVLFAILILMASCATQRRCAQRFPPQVVAQDSTSLEKIIEYKDTIITTPGDSVFLHDTLPCPGVNYTKEVKSKSGRTTATATIRNNHLSVDCRTDSLELVINSLRREYNNSTRNITKTITVANPADAALKAENKRLRNRYNWLIIVIVLVVSLRIYFRLKNFKPF